MLTIYDNNYLRDEKNAKPTITLWKWLSQKNGCHMSQKRSGV